MIIKRNGRRVRSRSEGRTEFAGWFCRGFAEPRPRIRRTATPDSRCRNPGFALPQPRIRVALTPDSRCPNPGFAKPHPGLYSNSPKRLENRTGFIRFEIGF